MRDDYEVNGTDQSTAQMDASADAGREIEAATAVLRGKTAVLRGKEDVVEYDVFLSYHFLSLEGPGRGPRNSPAAPQPRPPALD